jgi:hypothetical protein
MTTRTYSDLYLLIESFCGVSFADIEKARIRALVNSRAKRAYRATEYWPRFFQPGEERIVTNGAIPYEQSPLSTIDTFLRVFRTAPYYQSSAQELDFSVGISGVTLVIGSLEVDAAFVSYKSVCAFNYGEVADGGDPAIPDEWFEYLAHGTYSDFLRGEGQQEKAILAEQEARDKLDDELLRISDTGMLNLVANKVTTVGGMQNRWGGYYANP